MNTIVISTIKHCYWSYLHQLSDFVNGGPTNCGGWSMVEGDGRAMVSCFFFGGAMFFFWMVYGRYIHIYWKMVHL